MRSTFIMITKNIRKKRLQSILIGLIIMVAAAVLSTSLGVLFSAKDPFVNMFDTLKGSHDLVTLEPKMYNIEELQYWWQERDNVEGTQSLEFYEYTGKSSVGDKKFNTEFKITERKNESMNQDKLFIVEGDQKSNPDAGEVWIPTGFAYQNKIKVGDKLNLNMEEGKVPLEVSAIVVDAQYSSPMLNPTRIWITPGGIESLTKDRDHVKFDLGIRFKDYSSAPKLWGEFENYLKSPLIAEKMSYTFTEYVYTVQYQLTSAVLIVLALIIVAVAMFIIGFTITNAILTDYKTIGVLKAQGFSNSNITWIYCGQYSVLSLISVLTGIVVSSFLIRQMLSSLLKTTGAVRLQASMGIPYMITFVFVMIIAAAASWLTASKAGKIKPVEAIRYGAPPKKYRSNSAISIMRLKKFSIPVLLGIKQVNTYRRQSLFLYTALAITVFIVTFSINVSKSLSELGNNTAYWGFDNSELQITRQGSSGGISNDDLIAQLKKDDRVKVLVPYHYVSKNIIKNNAEEESQGITAFIYDGDMDAIGMMNIDGRNPVEDNEVSIAINTSRKNNKKVGDYIDILVNGKKKTFLVTGVYQMLVNGAEGYRAQKSAIIDAVPDFQPVRYSIVLKPGTDKKLFMKDIEARYGDQVDIKETSEALGSLFLSIGKNATVPIQFIAITFLVVAFITIFNTILINIHEEKKNFGIFKALGITAWQIRLSIVYRVVFLTMLALLSGIPLGIWGTPEIIGAVLSRMGMVKFPFVVTIPGTILVLILCSTIVVLGAWFPSSKIEQINPRNLIEE